MSLDFDAVSREQLDRPTSRKWSLHPGSIGAWVAEMDFGTAPAVQEALVRGVQDQLFGYLTPALRRDASEAASDWYGDEYGWRPDPRRIHSVSDVLSALELTVRHFSRPESAVIVPTPAYMPFLTLPRTLGRRLLQVPGRIEAGRWVLDLERLDRAFASGGGTLVLCNPNNPTGRVYDREELTRIAEVVERHGGIVFVRRDPRSADVRRAGTSPTRASPRRPRAHTITGDERVEGVEHPGAEGRPGHPLVRAARAAVAGGRHRRTSPSRRPSGSSPAIAAYRDGRAGSSDVPRLPRPEPPPAGRPARGDAPRGRVHRSGGDLPGVARLRRARAPGGAGALVPRAGRCDPHRRRAVRHGLRAARPARVRDPGTHPAGARRVPRRRGGGSASAGAAGVGPPPAPHGSGSRRAAPADDPDRVHAGPA